MININDYILEKLHIDKNYKSDNGMIYIDIITKYLSEKYDWKLDKEYIIRLVNDQYDYLDNDTNINDIWFIVIRFNIHISPYDTDIRKNIKELKEKLNNINKVKDFQITGDMTKIECVSFYFEK